MARRKRRIVVKENPRVPLYCEICGKEAKSADGTMWSIIAYRHQYWCIPCFDKETDPDRLERTSLSPSAGASPASGASVTNSPPSTISSPAAQSSDSAAPNVATDACSGEKHEKV